MKNNIELIEKLSKEFSYLPGVGEKTALKMAYFYVYHKNLVGGLINSLSNVFNNVEECSICHIITTKDNNPCNICTDERRDKHIICIVESTQDVFSIEKSNSFNGIYHVLGGLISPISGISYKDLHILDLPKRINSSNFEILIATNLNTEGDATALFIRNLFKNNKSVKFSRLASGLPIGGDLQYTDEYTIGKAVSGRVKYESQD